MKVSWASAGCGLLFALGLGLSGMTDPRQVIAFLDVSGNWDPSLAFVMMGAIGVHFAFARRALARPTTIHGQAIELPTSTAVDTRLLAGAALFGLGWGVAGYCPGPALVSLAGGTRTALAFVASMVIATVLFVRWEARRPQPRPRGADGG